MAFRAAWSRRLRSFVDRVFFVEAMEICDLLILNCEPALRYFLQPSDNWLFFHHQNFFRAINLDQLHFNHFVHRSLYGSSYKAGLDRKLAMTSVDQDA